MPSENWKALESKSVCGSRIVLGQVAAKSLGLSTVWINRRHDKGGFGATPPAQAQPDLEVPDLQTLAGIIGLM